METVLTIITVVLSDATVFIALQVIIFGVFVYSITIGRSRTTSRAHIRPLRMSDLVLAYSLISASLIQAISSVEVLAQFKLGIIIVNLVASFYLCFFSPWFQGIVAHVSTKVGREVRSA